MFDSSIFEAVQAAMAQAEAAGAGQPHWFTKEHAEWLKEQAANQATGQGTRVSEEERERMEARRCFVICEAARARGWRARFVREAGLHFGLPIFSVEFWSGKEIVKGNACLNTRSALMSGCEVLVTMRAREFY